jgi:hypothetical protein
LANSGQRKLFRRENGKGDRVFQPIYRVDGNTVLCTSQASCRSPDYERGAGLLPDEARVLVGITICEKSPAEYPVAITADKR